MSAPQSPSPVSGASADMPEEKAEAFLARLEGGKM